MNAFVQSFVPIVAAYLLGSLSFSYLIVRLLKGVDIRTVGSGNAGATNVLRVAGRGPAIVALLADVSKGALAVVLARWLGASAWVVAAVGVAAVLGHVFPLFFGFRGGKGVATAAGTLGALMPLATVVSLALFIVVVAVSRYVSLGSILAAAVFPLTVLVFGATGWLESSKVAPMFVSVSLIALVVVVKHRTNITRLLAGTEARLGRSAPEKAAPTDPQMTDSGPTASSSPADSDHPRHGA